MHGSKELDILLGKGYESSVADGIRRLVKMLDENKELAADFDPVAEEYAKNPDAPISEPLQKIAEISRKHGVNEYSLDLLFVINGLPYMHERFKEKGLSDEVFYETMDDVRCKVNECIECYGVIGTFVAGWDDRFFKATCFGFGRFQFEVATYGGSDFALSCGKVMKNGDKYINMHIPSRGIPLTDEVRYDSYRKAYRYFKPLFDDGVVIFGCHSWLLFDKHLEFLPENLNIRKFLCDFELVHSKEAEEFEDRWRVFGRYSDLPDSELPRDTALRKAYAEWLCSGHKTGYGFGLFAFDGKNIQRRSFFDAYCDLRARLAPFKLKTDFETVKTVSIINILLERAVNVNAGASTKGRFGFGPGHTVENYMRRAKNYIEVLERGEFPLKGKFTEPGIALVDHSFVLKDGRMHVFYNRGYIGYEWDTMTVDTVGHAVTDDLINWKIEPPCLSVDKNLYEEYQVWAPGVTEKDGKYYMYYAGVNNNVAQAICLAVSDDLYTWKKYENNPVLKPGKWCDWDAGHWSDCRDAMVFVDTDGRAYMYYCTSKKTERGSVPAVGVASSSDMINWRDEGAYTYDICDYALESPFVCKHGGRYYMFYTNCNHGTSYAVSDNPVNGWESLGTLIPWIIPPLCPANVPSCAEVFEFKGKWYISSCLREPGCEQYLELFELFWNADGSVTVGKRIE